MRILLAEDDLTSRMFMQKYLSRYGTCDVVMNGLEAIDRVEQAIQDNNLYDFICLDIMMPKVNGLTALKEIRKIEKKKLNSLQKKSKIVMTTALNDKVSVNEAYDNGCNAYAWKPIDLKQFNEMMVELDLI